MKMIIALIFLSLSSTAFAQQLAFPTAEGFGRFATGGRGGVVCHVTSRSTAETGAQIGGSTHYAGTLRYCVKTTAITSPRTVIFDVAGTFNFSQEVTLSSMWLTNPNITIAAQTAPGEGVQFKGLNTEVKTSNVIIRFYKSRLGNVVKNGATPPPSISYDPLSVWQGASTVIIDHASLEWGNDENTSHGNNADLITIQHSLIAEGLTGLQASGYCLLVDPNSDHQPRLSIIKNIMHRCKDRHPFIKGGKVQLINNLISGTQNNTVIVPMGSAVDVEIIGNSYRDWGTSPGTFPRVSLIGHPWPTQLPQTTTTRVANSSIYFKDNRHNTLRAHDGLAENSFSTNQSSTSLLPQVTSPLGFPSMQILEDQDDVRANRLATAGAIKPVRDDTDSRIITNLTNETVSVAPLNTENDSGIGGYETLTGTDRDGSYDTDHDGMPNTWETACSSSVNTASTNHTGLSNSNEDDGALIVSTTGYSALEHYLNEVAGDYSTGSCGGLLSNDTTPPTGVAITAPSAGPLSPGNVTYTATASDGAGIDRVEFYQNRSLITSDTSSPYSITWDTTTVLDGDVILHVVAYDTSNNSTASADVTVEVDNDAAYVAVHVGSAPTINGNLSEFADANLVNLTGTTNTTDLRIMWDDTALYIGAVTTDTQLVADAVTHDTSSSPQIFNDDALEFVIDTDNDGVWETTDYKFIVNAASTTWDAKNLSDLTYEPTYSEAVSLVTDLNDGADDTSWTLEMAIPWAQMGITPEADDIYGMNVHIDDKDASRTTYTWHGAVNTLANAEDVVLGAPSGDTEDPTNVAITDPLGGAYIGGSYLLQATADDNSGVASVEFLEGANTLCTDTSAPFTCSWDTTGESEGAYSLTVEACDVVSPTPNCVTSSPATSVTVDNTAPTNPSSLTSSSGVSDGELNVTLNWTASTDASGSLTYGIEECVGVSCSSFTEIDTSSTNSYVAPVLSEMATYCYRIRAYDAAGNPSSGYSNTECEETLDIVFIEDTPSNLSVTASSTVTVPSVPTGVSITAASTPADPSPVTGLTLSGSSTVTFPPVVTGVE